MRKKTKTKIKKLAKQTLAEKWYPIQKGSTKHKKWHKCSFCIDTKKKNGISLEVKDFCANCYIYQISPVLCEDISNQNTNEIISRLEQLAEFGEIKDE